MGTWKAGQRGRHFVLWAKLTLFIINKPALIYLCFNRMVM